MVYVSNDTSMFKLAGSFTLPLGYNQTCQALPPEDYELNVVGRFIKIVIGSFYLVGGWQYMNIDHSDCLECSMYPLERLLQADNHWQDLDKNMVFSLEKGYIDNEFDSNNPNYFLAQRSGGFTLVYDYTCTVAFNRLIIRNTQNGNSNDR